MINTISYRDFANAVTLGIAFDGDFHWEVKIPVDDFIRHTLIVGTTGSGKTTTSAIIAAQLAKHGHVLVMDWNDEYTDILNSLGVSNVLSSDVTLPAVLDEIEDFIGMLSEVLELTDAQAYLLYKLLDEFNSSEKITFNDLIAYLESIPLESKWMAETKTALLRKLRMIYNAKTKYLYNSDRSRLLQLLNKGNRIYIVSLRRLRDVKLKRLAILTMIGFIERLKELNKDLPNIYIVIDEAHNVISSTFINRMIAEVRKLGIGFILVTQSPSLMGSNALTNCNIKIIHATKSHIDIDLITKSLGIEGLKEILPRLNVGEAVVDAPSLSNIAKVKVSYRP